MLKTIILCLLISHFRAQQIEKTIATETKTAGQEGQLVCTVSEKDPPHRVVWQKINGDSSSNIIISADTNIQTSNPKDGKGVEKYKVEIRELTEFMLTFTLKIRRLQDADSGWYECFVLIPGDPEVDWPREKGRLIVQLPPSLTSDITPFVKTAVGNTAELYCDASGVPDPRISWTRANGAPLANGATIFRGKKLVIQNVTSSDRGTYRCRAENDVKPPALSDITLDVHHAPVVKPFRSTVGQAPGRNYKARMSCIVTGNPEPVARWYRVEGLRRTELSDSEKYKVERLGWLPATNMRIGDFWLELEIKNVGDGDAGTYQCDASNEYGLSTTKVNLFMTTTCQTWHCWREVRLSSANNLQYDSIIVTFSIILARFVFV